MLLGWLLPHSHQQTPAARWPAHGYSAGSVVAKSGFTNVEGIVADAQGDLYVADRGHSYIQVFPVTGGGPASVGYGFVDIEGIAVDALGNVYEADGGSGAVFRVPAGGGIKVSIASGFNGVIGVAVDPRRQRVRGRLWR